MANLKRLATPEDSIISIQFPINKVEIDNRLKDYNKLTPRQFGTRYKGLLFQPIEFNWNGQTHHIQFNFCHNPFCKWHGLEQIKFNVKGKSQRYKLAGGNNKSIVCNPDPIEPRKGITLGCHTRPLSNWSIALEIERLIRIGKVENITPEYQFHKEDCPTEKLTPFETPKGFYKQGKSKVGAQVWQCKVCKKKTNILPNTKQTTKYRQKRSEIMPTFANLLINKTPINRACDILGIGKGTYYDKLEILYRRCLEFLERYETKPIKQLKFDEIWLNTDKMNYVLNNVRKKGQASSRFDSFEELQLPTSVVITSDLSSRYVFRADVAYDWDIDLNDIALDTILTKEDHLNDFVKKHARFGDYSHFPQPPSPNDTETKSEYYQNLSKVEHRAKFIDGLHVNSTYTSIAHMWLLKQMINSKEWRFVTDEDATLMTSIYRVFSDEIRKYDAHHFLCQTDKTKTRKEAKEEFIDARTFLLEWGLQRDINTQTLRKLAKLYLTDLFESHQFHKEVNGGIVYADNPIQHPLATQDRGYRWVDCKTDLSSLDPKDIAELILNVNDNATNNFIQLIRRRLSFLERPLTTARGDGKSYIYSNFNPKYAQYALTILRTYYNFCLPYKTKEGKKEIVKTPAQRLGLTQRFFTLNDIIYLQ
ncbi:IS1 family transposase [Bacillus timonensis]|uniref:IS1 family transposase n=1 Tax=Bacillus timonensis TaxID=1033734 RepID=A0A4S3PHP8_9BACI|nr:IS1 family transposase [Bacillus timonensis]